MFFFCDPVYQINVGGKKRKHSKVISDMKNIFTFYNPIRSIDRLINQSINWISYLNRSISKAKKNFIWRQENRRRKTKSNFEIGFSPEWSDVVTPEKKNTYIPQFGRGSVIIIFEFFFFFFFLKKTEEPHLSTATTTSTTHTQWFYNEI